MVIKNKNAKEKMAYFARAVPFALSSHVPLSAIEIFLYPLQSLYIVPLPNVRDQVYMICIHFIHQFP